MGRGGGVHSARGGLQREESGEERRGAGRWRGSNQEMAEREGGAG